MTQTLHTKKDETLNKAEARTRWNWLKNVRYFLRIGDGYYEDNN